MTLVEVIALGFQIIGVMTVAMTAAMTVWLMCSTGRARKQKPPASLNHNVTPIRGNGKMTDAEFIAWCHELDRNGT